VNLAHWHSRSETGPVIAEIVLYQLSELIRNCCGKDMMKWPGSTVKDVYRREVLEKYQRLTEFYLAAKERESVKRDEAAGKCLEKPFLRRCRLGVGLRAVLDYWCCEDILLARFDISFPT
jgi:hypothetical protein